MPLRDHLKNVERVTGKTPPELIGPPFPAAGFEVWEWFIGLNKKRQASGFSMNPISHLELQAFCQLHEISPSLWELDVLSALDEVAMDQAAKTAARNKGNTKK